MAGWLRAPPLLGADADKRENKIKRVPTRAAFDSGHEFKSVAVGILAKAEPPPKPQRPSPPAAATGRSQSAEDREKRHLVARQARRVLAEMGNSP